MCPFHVWAQRAHFLHIIQKCRPLLLFFLYVVLRLTCSTVGRPSFLAITGPTTWHTVSSQATPTPTSARDSEHERTHATTDDFTRDIVHGNDRERKCVHRTPEPSMELPKGAAEGVSRTGTLPGREGKGPYLRALD